MSPALQLPGVVAVFTAADFAGAFGEAWHAMLGEELVVPPPLAVGDVRHVGDPVAFVVAESRYVAEDTAKRTGNPAEAPPKPTQPPVAKPPAPPAASPSPQEGQNAGHNHSAERPRGFKHDPFVTPDERKRLLDEE